MILRLRKQLTLIVCLVLNAALIYGQNQSNLKFVNPWIGTSNTRTESKWGDEGGTYPGAVAPFGYMQLTPETRVGDSNGYNYLDHSIYFFSCLKHYTGYPDGSSGQLRVMPIENNVKSFDKTYSRPFNHQDEHATAGYYKVKFKDKTAVEVTAAEHTGMFRFTFPANTQPKIFLGSTCKFTTVSESELTEDSNQARFIFNTEIRTNELTSGGRIVSFASDKAHETVILMKIGASEINLESSKRNLQEEIKTWNFDQYKLGNELKWTKALSVITIDDTSSNHKTIFYTALYHSMLMPWIVSDVDGKYRGVDQAIHQSRGKNEYDGFSAWDTFRSLHPLITLLFPERQQEMITSILDQFEQSGALPKGPMTGNHILPILVDSYFKKIDNFDRSLAWRAMTACLDSASKNADFSLYQKLGYVPSSISESVTKTVEYAYDDWVLSQFADQAMHLNKEAKKLLIRSKNYHNLFNPQELALLPRLGTSFNTSPGNSGYKEGDQWSYSLFVPHNPVELMDLFGGKPEFANHLEQALSKSYIPFDNEPVLHVPYFFNFANRSDLTQKWLHTLMKSHFSNAPWGLPGNDDHGAMSSWFVFSALGFYPFCPGNPSYELGTPLFNKATIHLPNGKDFTILGQRKSTADFYVNKMLLNNSELPNTSITHSDITAGGKLTFEISNLPKIKDLKSQSSIKITADSISQSKIYPNQNLVIFVTLKSIDFSGTQILRLMDGQQEIGRKNIVIHENTTITDSIQCQIYAIGKHSLSINNSKSQIVEVVSNPQESSIPFHLDDIKSRSIAKAGEQIQYSVQVKNLGGQKKLDTVRIFSDGQLAFQKAVNLTPGECFHLTHSIRYNSAGMHVLSNGTSEKKIKIYATPIDSKLIDLQTTNSSEILEDHSGLGNQAKRLSKNEKSTDSSPGIATSEASFAKIEATEDLNHLGEKITVMAWIKPLPGNDGMTDILSKGDFIALQTSNNQSLSWFAGGWGRGSCSAKVPANWLNHWHHVAGTANGKILTLVIDGVQQAKVILTTGANLSTTANWLIGRNEEFPDQRFFNGIINHFKIFVEPLSIEEIKAQMKLNQEE